jgi:hypothetical protein
VTAACGSVGSAFTLREFLATVFWQMLMISEKAKRDEKRETHSVCTT